MLLCLFALACHSLCAQTIITGTVTAETLDLADVAISHPASNSFSFGAPDGTFVLDIPEPTDSIFFSCVNFQTVGFTALELTQQPNEIQLVPIAIELKELELVASPPTAAQLLKNARKKIKSSYAKSGYSSRLEVTLFSRDNGTTVRAARAIADVNGNLNNAQAKHPVWINELWLSQNHELESPCYRGGIGFGHYFDNGYISKAFQPGNLKDYKVDSTVWENGALIYVISNQQGPNPATKTYFIRHRDYAIVRIDLLKKGTGTRSRMKGESCYWQVMDHVERYRYREIGAKWYVASVNAQRIYHFFQSEAANLHLANQHDYQIHVTRIFPDKENPIADNERISAFQTLFDLDNNAQSWEKWARNADSPLIQAILLELTSGPIAH